MMMNPPPVAPSAGTPCHRIFILDDHPVVREGLMSLIASEPDMEVCGEADNAPDALRAIKKNPPDVLMLDLGLKGRNGIELIEELRESVPGVAVLVLSINDEGIFAERVLRAGARGYLMKHEPAKTILEGIRTVLGGDVWVSPRMRTHLLGQMVTDDGRKPRSGLASLSNREMEIFEKIAQGLPTREISRRLNLSPKTVETHRARIKRKLNLPDATALIHYAVHWLDSGAEIPRDS